MTPTVHRPHRMIALGLALIAVTACTDKAESG